MKERVLVAMSGGVDSSVAALLLQQAGYEVAGATFELFDGCNENNVLDARAVCAQLGIAHHVFDYRAKFRSEVLDPFCQGYQEGCTPNPCIFCNRAIKFGAFFEDATAMGFTKISTGHYARVRYDEAAGLYRLFCSSQLKKDQSYVLYSLMQTQLSALLLPLEGLEKPQVRALAAEAQLPVQSKSDSQDICFVPDGDYVRFMEAHTKCTSVPGDYVDENGTVIGRHRGCWHYTIGQRKGLGVSFGAHRFVSAIDPQKNRVTLSDEAAVFHNCLYAEAFSSPMPQTALLQKHGLSEGVFLARAKIRYAHTPAPCRVTLLEEGRVRVEFETAQRAITPGQTVVFYSKENEVLGGARIHYAVNATA